MKISFFWGFLNFVVVSIILIFMCKYLERVKERGGCIMAKKGVLVMFP